MEIRSYSFRGGFMVIKVDYIRVNSFLSEMMRLTEEVMREFERMDEVVEDFSIFWDSEASGEYGMRIYTDLYNANRFYFLSLFTSGIFIILLKTFSILLCLPVIRHCQ